MIALDVTPGGNSDPRLHPLLKSRSHSGYSINRHAELNKVGRYPG